MNWEMFNVILRSLRRDKKSQNKQIILVVIIIKVLMRLLPFFDHGSAFLRWNLLCPSSVL